MTWEIKINRDECPYLKEVGTPPHKELKCENFDNRTYICSEYQCPKKV